MDGAERRLANHQDERPTLLDHDVGRAVDQVFAEPTGDRRKASCRAGRDHHAVDRSRARRHQGSHVPCPVVMIRERTKIVELLAGLVLQRPLAPLADDEMRLDRGLSQHFEQAHAVNGAARPGDADDQAVDHRAVPFPQVRAAVTAPRWRARAQGIARATHARSRDSEHGLRAVPPASARRSATNPRRVGRCRPSAPAQGR